MERFKIFAVVLVSIASAVAVNQWEEGSCERAAYDILTKHFHCTVRSGEGGSGLRPDDFCAFPWFPWLAYDHKIRISTAFPWKLEIDQISPYCPSLSTGSPDSKDDDADAGWYRSMCESPVWAEDEGFRNCSTWTDYYG